MMAITGHFQRCNGGCTRNWPSAATFWTDDDVGRASIRNGVIWAAPSIFLFLATTWTRTSLRWPGSRVTWSSSNWKSSAFASWMPARANEIGTLPLFSAVTLKSRVERTGSSVTLNPSNGRTVTLPSARTSREVSRETTATAKAYSLAAASAERGG